MNTPKISKNREQLIKLLALDMIGLATEHNQINVLGKKDAPSPDGSPVAITTLEQLHRLISVSMEAYHISAAMISESDIVLELKMASDELKDGIYEVPGIGVLSGKPDADGVTAVDVAVPTVSVASQKDAV